MSTGGIGRRLSTGVAALAVLVLVASGVSICVGTSMKGEFDRTARGTARDLDLAHDIVFDALTLQSEQRRLLLSALGADPVGLREAKAALQSSRASVDRHLADMQARTATADTRARAASIVERLRAWDAVDATIQQLVSAGDASAAWDAMRKSSAPLLDGVRVDTEAMVTDFEAAAVQSIQTADDAYRFMWWLQVSMLVLSVPVTLMVALSVRRISNTLRTVSAHLGENAEHVASAAAQVAAASQELSKGANEQASSIGDTSSAMAKMSSSVRRNAESSISVATMTDEAAALIGTANDALRGMVLSMSAIKTSSDKVARIIKTIDEIAFQTNILALNAAVEAARAGEAGMGFAVVADEVRNLAQRSAHAAKDTATLIEESIARAEEGQDRVEQVTEAVSAVSASAARIQQVIEGVSASSRDQIHEIEQVTRAVGEIERVTQSTAASAEEHAAVGQEIAAQAAAAMATVRRLTALVEGDGTRKGRPTSDAGPAGARANVVSLLARRSPSPHDDLHDHSDVSTGTFGRF